MNTRGYLLLLLGLGLFIGLLIYYGLDDIFSAMSVMGWGLGVVVASHLLPLFIDCLSWRFLFVWERIPGFHHILYSRWIGEAVNALLPSAQVAGDVVRARILALHGYSPVHAGASVFTEIAVALISQTIFALIGIVCLMIIGCRTVILNGMIGFVILIGFFALFFFAYRRGFWSGLIGLLSVLVGKERMQEISGSAEAMDQAIREIYQHKGSVAIAVVLRLIGWMAGAVEVWVALWFLDSDPSVPKALLLESLGHMIRGAAFLVPGAIGVQEGGFVFLGSLVGLTPEISLSVSLSKRVRELVLGIPALLAWQIEEGRNLFFRQIKRKR